MTAASVPAGCSRMSLHPDDRVALPTVQASQGDRKWKQTGWSSLDLSLLNLSFRVCLPSVCKFVFFFFNESKLQDTDRLRLARMALLPLYSLICSPRSTWRLPAFILSLQLGCVSRLNGPALWSLWGLVIGGLVSSPTVC